MNVIKAKKTYPNTVTRGVLKRALARGEKAPESEARAISVCYLAALDALLVRFVDQTGVLLPVNHYAEFSSLTVELLNRIQIGYGGRALCLEQRDLHVSLVGLAASSKALMSLAAALMVEPSLDGMA